MGSTCDFGTYRIPTRQGLAYPAGLETLIFIEVSLYTHTLCMRAAKALASLRIWASSLEHSLLDNATSTSIPYTGLILCVDKYCTDHS